MPVLKLLLPQSRWRAGFRADWLLVIAVLFTAGCQNPGDPETEQTVEDQPDTPLRVMVTDDPELAQAIAGEWKSRNGAKITVTNITTAELLESKSLKTDLIIYPSAQLGNLVERRLVLPLREYLADGAAKHNRELLPSQQMQEVHWGPEVYATSFGSPQLVLYYRSDIFLALKLQPPETWSDYQQLLTVLGDRERVDPWLKDKNQRWMATAEPVGPGWAAVTLLARAAAYTRHPDQYSGVFDYLTLEPLIEGPPFVRALEELQRATSNLAVESLPTTPDDTRRLFYQGNAAMALSWPSLTASNQTEPLAGEPVSTRWALLPGSREVFNASDTAWEKLPQQESPHVPLLAISGRLGSVSRNSSHPQWSTSSLLLLTSPDWSSSVSRHSRFTTMFRSNHLADPIPWMDVGTTEASGDQFADVFRQASSSSRVMFCLRIPGRQRYLAALDQAVLRTLRKESSVAEALAEAARQWEEITEQLGRKEQELAYRQSLGLAP